MSKRFTSTDVGSCIYFLGVKINRTKVGSLRYQRPLTEKIISLAGSCTPTPTASPILLSHALYDVRRERTAEEEEAMVFVLYRRVLGSLLFLSTRSSPDISTAVSMFTKSHQSPFPEHWTAMKTFVRYVIETKGYGLLLPFLHNALVESCSDVDWRRDKHKRRFNSIFLVTIAGGPVLWSSRLQSLTAPSTTEVKFVALSHCHKEINCIHNTMKEFYCVNKGPNKLYVENLSTISWTPEIHGLRNIKHIGIRYYSVLDAIDAGTVEVRSIPTDESKADNQQWLYKKFGNYQKRNEPEARIQPSSSSSVQVVDVYKVVSSGQERLFFLSPECDDSSPSRHFHPF